MHHSRKSWLRLISVALFSSLLVFFALGTACGPGQSTGCKTDSECGTGKKCNAGKCEGTSGGSGKVGDACSASGDCDSGLFCSGGKCAEPECDVAGKECPAGQKCNAGKCEGASGGCQGDGDCPPGQKCDAGACKVEEVDSKIASVEIISAISALRESTTAQLKAVAYNKSGARLPGPHSFQWASSDAEAVKVDGSSGLVTGGSKDGAADITAELNGVKSKPLNIRNFAKVADGKVRLIVRSNTGEAVSGATVKVGEKEAKTDADGSATLDGAAPFDVHVFHKDFSYFSAYGVGKTDLFVQLIKNNNPNKAGGVKGKFDFGRVKKLLNISDEDWEASIVGFGLAGFSIGGNLIDLDPDVLLGESFKTQVFGFEANLPSGLLVEVGGGGKPEYQAQTIESKGIVWGLGGKFKIDQVQPLITAATAEGDVDVGKILADALPLLKQFVFGHVPDVSVSQYDKVKDVDDKNGNNKQDDLIPNFDKFPTKNIVLENKLDQTINVSIGSKPKAPKHNGKDVEFYVISLAGVRVAGAGVIPLGLAVGDASTSKLEVKYASPTGVLSSGKLLVLTIVLTLPIGENAPPLYVAGDLQFLDSPGSVSVSSFVNLGTTAKYAPGERKLSGASAEGSTLQMLRVANDKKSWLIVANGKSEITLPKPPAGMADPSTDDASALFFGVKLKGETLDSLLEFNATNMDRLIEVTSGFSNVTAYEKE